jgi:antitoxin HicB
MFPPTLDYPVIVEPIRQQDGGGFIATVPDLPGCMSDGETPEEALANVWDAIAAWIDEARSLNRMSPVPSRLLGTRF